MKNLCLFGFILSALLLTSVFVTEAEAGGRNGFRGGRYMAPYHHNNNQFYYDYYGTNYIYSSYNQNQNFGRRHNNVPYYHGGNYIYGPSVNMQPVYTYSYYGINYYY